MQLLGSRSGDGPRAKGRPAGRSAPAQTGGDEYDQTSGYDGGPSDVGAGVEGRGGSEDDIPF
jgi:hypothetical protein